MVHFTSMNKVGMIRGIDGLTEEADSSLISRRLGVGAQSLLEGYVKAQGGMLANTLNPSLSPSLQFEAATPQSKVTILQVFDAPCPHVCP